MKVLPEQCASGKVREFGPCARPSYRRRADLQTARAGRASYAFQVGAVAVEAQEATQRSAPGNSLVDEQEALDAGEAEEVARARQGEAVLAMLGALQEKEREGKLYRQEGFLSNAVEMPGSMRLGTLEEAERDSETAAAEAEGSRRRRGRPKGSGCWNKGRSMPKSTRDKISASQKARWRRCSPEQREENRMQQLGKVPWNKGKPMSLEARKKMSAAKRMIVLPAQLRTKMSLSHIGQTHTPETCALLSQQLLGKKKSAEHRAAIGAGQRRRLVAAKIWGALSEQQQCGAAVLEPLTTAPPAAPAPSPTPTPQKSGGGGSDEARPEIPGSGHIYTGEAAPGSRPRPKRKPPVNEAVIGDFVTQLREFRALQEELAPWTSKFREQHGRKPRVADVELTGIPWLAAKFKEYMSMRERVLNHSQQLRSTLEAGTYTGQPQSSSEKMNANGTAGATASEGATRIAKALQYKRSGAESLVPATVAGKSAASGAAAPAMGASSREAEAAPERKAADGKSQAESGKEADKGGFKVPSKVATASPRVRDAMMAAAQYRKKKQQKPPSS